MRELHEIRKNIAAQNLTPDEINRRGNAALARFGGRKTIQYSAPSAKEPITVQEPKKDYNH